MEISSSPRGNLILELSQCAPRWLKCHFHPPQSAPPPLHRSIFNHHPLQPTWLFLFRFLISLQIWAAIPHLARGCVLCSTISPFSFFCPSIFLPHQSFLLFFLRLLLPPKMKRFPSTSRVKYFLLRQNCPTQWCSAAILSHFWHIATLISLWDEAQPQCGLARWSSGRGPELWRGGNYVCKRANIHKFGNMWNMGTFIRTS